MIFSITESVDDVKFNIVAFTAVAALPGQPQRGVPAPLALSSAMFQKGKDFTLKYSVFAIE